MIRDFINIAMSDSISCDVHGTLIIIKDVKDIENLHQHLLQLEKSLTIWIAISASVCPVISW